MNMDGIRNGMQVLGSDGGMVGEVDGLEGSRLKLKRGPGGGSHHYVPVDWIKRIDAHIHLDRDAALVREEWTSEGEARPSAAAAGGVGNAPRSRVIPWAIGIIFLLIILILGFRAFQYAGQQGDTEHALPAADSDVTGTGVGNSSE